MEGMPDSLTAWVKHAQTYHACWAMAKAYGYTEKKNEFDKGKPKWNLHKKPKEKDPDAMDVDRTFIDTSEKEKLMKLGSCFRCKKQGHLSQECPTRKTTIQEAKVEEAPKTNKKRKSKETTTTTPTTEEPPTYSSLLKQINTCKMEDRQKILELFSNDGDSEGEDF